MPDETFAIYERPVEQEKFYKFVNEQIEKMKKYSSLEPNNITFTDVNFCLCNFEQIYLTLLGLLTFTREDLKRENEIFDNWYAEKYILIRNRENRSDLTAQKWLSQKEIEMMVRVENKDMYIPMKTDLAMLESKVDFLEGLIKSWQSQQFILNTLSNNIQTEVSVAVKNY